MVAHENINSDLKAKPLGNVVLQIQKNDVILVRQESSLSPVVP